MQSGQCQETYRSRECSRHHNDAHRDEAKRNAIGVYVSSARTPWKLSTANQRPRAVADVDGGRPPTSVPPWQC